MKILTIGDIFGKPGRQTVEKVLPELKIENNIDLVIANIENITHGKGAMPYHLDAMRAAGVDVFTSGNHIWLRDIIYPVLNDPAARVLRPANYASGEPGRGDLLIEEAGQNILIVNLQGQTFMKDQVDNPFDTVDRILQRYEAKKPLVIIDFHAEATSEKIALKHYLDGRITILVGTHTHVPTADLQITAKGTGYITDLGMVGAVDSVIGVDKEVIIQSFRSGVMQRHLIPDCGTSVFSAALFTEEGGKVVAVERIEKTVLV